MGKALLSEAEFSRVIVNRARRERPDIKVQPMGNYLLLVEPEDGKRRVVSLVTLYQSYCEAPVQKDKVISAFLETLVYEEPADIQGSFDENRHKVMPQVVPVTLLDYCRQDNRELAAVPYIAGLAIAFVLDEDERYTYIHHRIMTNWGVDEATMLRAAMENLQRLSHESGSSAYRIGADQRVALVWETFDGYDASRMLLARELVAAAAMVPGNPLIGVPNRDYMVVFGDTDPAFVAEMRDRIREDFEAHDYPITSRLFTLVDGVLAPYEEARGRQRLVN